MKKSKKRTARPFHKKVALHPAAILALLCAGALLISWTYKASADASNASEQGASTNVVVRISNPDPVVPTSVSSTACHANILGKVIDFITVSSKECQPKTGSTGAPPNNYKWLWMAWPVYTAIAVTTGAIWIGEQQGAAKLARLLRLTHHTRRPL